MKDLSLQEADALVASGALYVDLRPVRPYLEVHVPGSLALVYEFGPGLASRARDCLPLEPPLVLLENPDVDIRNAAAALRGKGFTVPGIVRNGLDHWSRAHGHPASTDELEALPADTIVLDVADPGARAPEDAVRIPVELLWHRAHELRGESVAVAAGFGVRAALAVGILERAGGRAVALWWTSQRSGVAARR